MCIRDRGRVWCLWIPRCFCSIFTSLFAKNYNDAFEFVKIMYNLLLVSYINFRTKWWWVYRSDCSALCRRTRSISHRRSSYTSTYQPYVCLPLSFDIWNFTTLYYYLSVALLCTDVQSNADVALVDNKGLSVLHYACLGQHMSCVRLLLNKEAPVLLKDEVILCATLLVASTLMVIDHYGNLRKSS